MILNARVGHAIKDCIELRSNGVERRILCIFFFVDGSATNARKELVGRRRNVGQADLTRYRRTLCQAVMGFGGLISIAMARSRARRAIVRPSSILPSLQYLRDMSCEDADERATVRFAEAGEEHGLVAKILDESRVVDDRLDVRKCHIEPFGFDGLHGARHPRSRYHEV